MHQAIVLGLAVLLTSTRGAAGQTPGDDGTLLEQAPCPAYVAPAYEATVASAKQFHAEEVVAAEREGKVEEFGGADVDDVRNLVPVAASLGIADLDNFFLLGWSRDAMEALLALRTACARTRSPLAAGCSTSWPRPSGARHSSQTSGACSSRGSPAGVKRRRALRDVLAGGGDGPDPHFCTAAATGGRHRSSR